MTELINIVFFILGIGVSFYISSMSRKNVDENSKIYKMMPPLFFIFLWNSEYIAVAILFFAFIYLKNTTSDVDNTLKILLYTLIFTVFFRKIKDMSMQYLIELNLEQIK